MSNFIKTTSSLFRQNITLLFGLLLLTMVISRFGVAFSDKSSIIVAPEKMFQVVPIGIDFFTGVLKPALRIMDGTLFYDDIAVYGPALAVSIIPAIRILTNYKLCNLVDIYSCSYILYHWLLAITLSGYVLLIWLVNREAKKETVNIAFVYFTTFLLSFPGSFGLERGNIDIILSLLIGFLLYLSLHVNNVSQGKLFFKWLLIIIIGLIAGFTSNVKIFLLLFASIAIFVSPVRLVSAFVFLVTFLGLTYLPRVFGTQAGLPELLRWSMLYIQKAPVTPFHTTIQYNHSLAATASLFTSCIWKQTCSNAADIIIISTVSKFLFVVTFVFPVFTLSKARRKIVYVSMLTFKKMRNGIPIVDRILKQIDSGFHNRSWIVFLFIIGDALINLVPTYSFTFRLYYSLPILLILFKETEDNSQARKYCVFSMVFLAIKGLWIFLVVNPYGADLFEPRGMNFFVILHFYYAIKAGAVLAFFPKAYITNKPL